MRQELVPACCQKTHPGNAKAGEIDCSCAASMAGEQKVAQGGRTSQ